jgi:CcmD family protein
VNTGEKYLAAAYVVVLVTILGYLLIHSLRLSRLARELADLAERARRRREEPAREPERERVG